MLHARTGQRQLIRSDKNKTGYKGVAAHSGRDKGQCNAPPCHGNNLGAFDTPEDAAQAYLQHQQQEHEHAAELKDVKPLAEEEDGGGGRACREHRQGEEEEAAAAAHARDGAPLRPATQ